MLRLGPQRHGYCSEVESQRAGAARFGLKPSALVGGLGILCWGSCGELAKSFGDRVDGRLAGSDVDDEVVDVVVAGA